MLKLRKRRFLILCVLSALVLWLGLSAWVDWQFICRSRPVFPELPPKVAWATIEGNRLKTSDGQELGAWLIRGDPQKGCVLVLHGLGTSRRGMMPVIQLLAEAHFTVLAITLRAHGDSTGAINDYGWSSRHDVLAAVEFIRREYPQRPIYILGRSLGAAAAVFAARDLKQNVAGYFLEQPYKDLKSAVWNRLQNRLPPVLDRLAYYGMRFWAPLFLKNSPDAISPYEHVSDIPPNLPIVVISGSADRYAPLDEVKELVAAVESHAKLVIFAGAGHEALDQKDPELYRRTLFEFLEPSAPKQATEMPPSNHRPG